MNFKANIKNNKLMVTTSLPIDNYKKYFDKFIEEFEEKKIISPDVLLKIITPLLGAKSWRLLNREIRKACNIYCHENKLMDVAVFQDLWFYEGTMHLRVTFGAKAAWLDGLQIVNTAAVKATKPIPATTAAIKAPVQKTTSMTYTDRNDGWIRTPHGAWRKPRW